MDIISRIRDGKCDEASLLEYITDNNIEIAIAAAESKNATEPILDIAAHDLDERVRMAATSNPNMGENTLRFLTNDKSKEIANKARTILERRKGNALVL